MRETSIMDNLNCKMQAHARVCKENKLELELEENDNDTYWNNFVVRGVCKFEGPYRESGGTYQDDIFKDDSL